VSLPDTVIDQAVVRRDYTRINTTTYWATSTAIVGASLESRAAKMLHTIIRLDTPDFKIMGALTGRGLDSVAGSGKVSGVDTVPPGWDCPEAGPPAAGLVVGDSALTTKSAGTCMTGGKEPTYYTCVDGSPKVKDSTALVNDMNTYSQFGGFNYDSLAKIADKTFTAEPNGTSFAAIRPSTTATTPPGCNYGDPNNWGAVIPTPETDPRGPCANYYPIIYLKGFGGADNQWKLDGAPGNGGQGILLVDGNLTIAGGFQWTGLILTKGYTRVEGAAPNAPKVLGAIMAANSLTPAVANRVQGDATVRFSRCAVNTIMAKRSRAVPMKYRAWADLSF
jgi:hypothetical protein